LRMATEKAKLSTTSKSWFAHSRYSRGGVNTVQSSATARMLSVGMYVLFSFQNYRNKTHAIDACTDLEAQLAQKGVDGVDGTARRALCATDNQPSLALWTHECALVCCRCVMLRFGGVDRSNPETTGCRQLPGNKRWMLRIQQQ
jgi:hypothetical protein